jgi:hemolysin activation/secretion protein
VTAPFTHRPITFAELLQAEAAVTQLYTEAGYINSGAIIAADQTLPTQGARVKIQIIEGSLEEIRVVVDGRLSPDYVRSRLELATERPLNQNRLLEALQLLQLNPLIQTISADLSAGSRSDLSVLSVKVQEADTFDIDLFADNGRVQSIGRFERGLRLNQGNLLGFGDSLGIEYSNTDGSNAVYANYTLPVNAHNGTVKLTGQFNNTRVIEEPFNQLDITGDSRYFDLTYRQPILQTPSQELALGLTAAREESETTLLGVGFPLSLGANNQGLTQISALRFFQEWIQRGSQDVLAFRSQFSLGIDAFDATRNPEPPDGQFFDWLGQGQYVRRLAPDTLLVLRSSLQLSANPLLSLEQFTLGGLYSVRGYRQDLLLTDNGIFASAEIRLPILRVDNIQGLLQIAPFVDFGVGWNNPNNPIPTPDPNTLISVGLGLQWQMGDRFNARLDWGIPMTQFEVGGTTVEQQALYFSINLKLF